MIERGDSVIERGDPVIERGDPVIDRGDPVIEHGDPLIEHGDPGGCLCRRLAIDCCAQLNTHQLTSGSKRSMRRTTYVSC